MIVKPKQEKIDKVFSHIKLFKENDSRSIRDWAHVIGLLVSLFPGVQHGPLFYRYLEIDKRKSLNLNRGNYAGPVLVSSKEDLEELHWWELNLPTASKPIQATTPNISITTDASQKQNKTKQKKKKKKDGELYVITANRRLVQVVNGKQLSCNTTSMYWNCLLYFGV
ncbi:hypothetical protein HOLleu_43859 [Holothuria leucospilota]|uniref:Uncharacterized protein n=1 Tax=Holothuria leucospilota TaxID=206669 RepID=A0A9Q0YA99_HOLLE|nr:hypothetical protein HOLleu_43859 [Holothuria leucospilota]